MNNLSVSLSVRLLRLYSLLLLDPPWSYKNGGNGAAKNHYPTMSNREIARLPVAQLAAPDSVMILWATWAHLEFAMRLISLWGFEYVTGLPWVKTQGTPAVDLFGTMQATPAYGTGFWLRGCSEPILIAKKGKMAPDNGNFIGLLSERMAHSRKPDSIYQLAEGFVPLSQQPEPVSHLEMFARRRRSQWDAFGHVEGSITLPEPETADRWEERLTAWKERMSRWTNTLKGVETT